VLYHGQVQAFKGLLIMSSCRTRLLATYTPSSKACARNTVPIACWVSAWLAHLLTCTLLLLLLLLLLWLATLFISYLCYSI
jgi:hypothetical protein